MSAADVVGALTFGLTVGWIGAWLASPDPWLPGRCAPRVTREVAAATVVQHALVQATQPRTRGRSPAAPIDPVGERLQLASVAGTPIPFPPDLPAEYRPQALSVALDAMQVTCPHARDRSMVLECGEYPCILWLEIPADDDRFHPGRCPEWTARAGMAPIAVFGGADPTTPFARGVMSIPVRFDGDGLDDEDVSLRLHYREGRDVPDLLEAMRPAEDGSPRP